MLKLNTCQKIKHVQFLYNYYHVIFISINYFILRFQKNKNLYYVFLAKKFGIDDFWGVCLFIIISIIKLKIR